MTIVRLRIADFKSIAGEVELDLAPLTLLVGGNSSGKSTVLQALLVLAQSATSPALERQVLLNGRFVRLGSIKDVLTKDRPTQHFSIGFDTEAISVPPSTDDPKDADAFSAAYERFTPIGASYDGRFSTPKESQGGLRRSEASIERVTLVGRVDDSKTASKGRGDLLFQARIARGGTEKRRIAERYEPMYAPHSEWRQLEYRPSIDARSRSEAAQRAGVRRADVRGVAFSHLFPSTLALRVNMNEVMPSRIVNYVTGAGSGYELDDLEVDIRLWRNLLGSLNFDVSRAFGEDTERLKVGEVRRYLASRPRLRQRLRQGWLEGPRVLPGAEESLSLETFPVPNRLAETTQLLRRALTQIRYVGPLRVQPSPVYPIAAGPRPDDVGTSGEWTAAVLDEYYETGVEYPFRTSEEEEVKYTTLGEAVAAVLLEMDLVKALEIRDRGNLGHEVLVAVEAGGELIPLAHVGVGVSQCLPVIVQCLIADRGDLIVLEQPELHLHPATQAKLADFLMGVTTTGKQVLVESHSEHIVTRIRRRVAESSFAPDRVAHYFAERESGRSGYRKVQIDDHGGMDSWPAGFFDQGQIEAEALLRAGMRRLRRKP